jgi:outer membrane immunogenic protein
MRSIALACVLLLGMGTAAMAQATSGVSHSGDAAITYHWVHTNAPPGGGCGCFDLNGGGISGSWNFGPRLAVVAEVSVDHTGKALSTTDSLTLSSFMAGARYHLPNPWMHGDHALQPFAQVLVGGAHAGGGIVGAGDGTTAFAGRLGGGIDLPVSPLIAIRIIQADFFLTEIANGADNHQNNILVGAGVVVRWSK